MRIAFRVDSSTDIGSGHLVRCLTLADYLKGQGETTFFICRDHSGHLGENVVKHGHPLFRLERTNEADLAACGSDLYSGWLGVSQARDAEETVSALGDGGGDWDWVVMDHYALDIDWQRPVRPHVQRLFVIDDLANRRHDCDVLLDQNLNAAGAARYRGLVPDHCTLLCGPEYALLRPEFEAARAGLRKRDGRVRRILVFYGGMDKSGETLKACQALGLLGRTEIAVDVIVGLGNPHREAIRQACEHFGFNCLGQVENMAERMAAADLALGAGGTTTWERARLGLPTVMTSLAENQVAPIEAMAAAETAWNLGSATDVSADALADAVARIIDYPEKVQAVGERSSRLFGQDSVPGVERVSRVMRSVVNAEA